MAPPDERVRDVLAKRAPVLRTLADESARKPSLVDRLDCSRSTVDRAVADLIEIGFVSEEGGRYAATTAGRLALREQER
ncbi:hypothetical protein ACFQE1_20005, partial [Halobium palmae]